MDIVWLAIAVIFVILSLAYVGFLDREGKLWKT
jgi:hypothetical protein